MSDEQEQLEPGWYWATYKDERKFLYIGIGNQADKFSNVVPAPSESEWLHAQEVVKVVRLEYNAALSLLSAYEGTLVERVKALIAVLSTTIQDRDKLSDKIADMLNWDNVTDAPSDSQLFTAACAAMTGVIQNWQSPLHTTRDKIVAESLAQAKALLSALREQGGKLPTDDEAEEVWLLWSDAVANLCNKIGVDPKSFDWSPGETSEETIGNIFGNIYERLPKEQPTPSTPDLPIQSEGLEPSSSILCKQPPPPPGGLRCWRSFSGEYSEFDPTIGVPGRFIPDTELAKQQATLSEQRDKVEALVEACKLVPEMRGHEHWDSTMKHGAGCPLCIRQGEISKIVRDAARELAQAFGLEKSE